jgi:hypothetical protein
MNVNPTNRQIQDASLSATTALPAQNTAAATGSIALGGGVNSFVGNEKFDLQLSVPATPSLANGQTLTFQPQDSADGVTFAAIPTLAPVILTGAGGVGAAASVTEYRLPGSARAFVNFLVTASATAGNNTAVSSTIALLF